MQQKKEIVYYSHMDKNIGVIDIAVMEDRLCYVGSQNKDINEMNNWFEKYKPNAELVEDAIKTSDFIDEITAYLNGEIKVFNIPIHVRGTSFQMAVWTALQSITYGKTKTYTEIAESIGNPSAVRAVGTAIGANPILIVVPCHRVISKSGKLTGYQGGISMKEKLLKLESD